MAALATTALHHRGRGRANGRRAFLQSLMREVNDGAMALGAMIGNGGEVAGSVTTRVRSHEATAIRNLKRMRA